MLSEYRWGSVLGLLQRARAVGRSDASDVADVRMVLVTNQISRFHAGLGECFRYRVDTAGGDTGMLTCFDPCCAAL